MEVLVNYFSNPVELEVDLFFGSFANVNVCVELPWHRGFSGCEVDANCLAASMEARVDT